MNTAPSMQPVEPARESAADRLRRRAHASELAAQLAASPVQLTVEPEQQQRAPVQLSLMLAPPYCAAATSEDLPF